MIPSLAANTSMQSDGDQLFLDILPWLGLVLLLVILLVGTIFIGRRMVRHEQQSDDQPFTLQSLRELHAAGQLSDEEFAKARDVMIGRVKAADSTDDERQRRTDDDDGSESSASSPEKRSTPDGENNDRTVESDEGPSPDHADNNEERRSKDGDLPSP